MLKTDRELFMTGRNLFTIQFCNRCALYSHIERFNSNMPPDKRIKVIDCTKWQETGIPDDPLIVKYSRYIDGFPILFFEGRKISGSNTIIEIDSFLKTFCANDFKLPVNIPYLFDKDCSYKNTFFGRRIVCQ